MNIIITRGAARTAGLPHYFTGKACFVGHVALRYVSTGNCVQCQKDRSKQTASATRRGYVARLQGLFAYALHPDDHAKALAYCQALDLDRGNKPKVPTVAAVLGVRTNEQIEEDRRRIFSGLRPPEEPGYMPKL